MNHARFLGERLRILRIPLVKQFRQNNTFHIHVYVYHGVDPFQSRPNIYIHRVISKYLVPQLSFLNLLQEKLPSSLTGATDQEGVRMRERLVFESTFDDCHCKRRYGKMHQMYRSHMCFINLSFMASIKTLLSTGKKFLKKSFIYSRTYLTKTVCQMLVPLPSQAFLSYDIWTSDRT